MNPFLQENISIWKNLYRDIFLKTKEFEDAWTDICSEFYFPDRYQDRLKSIFERALASQSDVTSQEFKMQFDQIGIESGLYPDQAMKQTSAILELLERTKPPQSAEDAVSQYEKIKCDRCTAGIIYKEHATYRTETRCDLCNGYGYMWRKRSTKQ